jgi:hypothetical protein
MHPCPCCGYRTLPERGDYDLCPVCWWEDEGLEPWEYSGPNGETLIEAQQAFLAERLPYVMRPGKVRAPRRKEARDPDWRPYELTDELLARVEQANVEQQRFWEELQHRADQEIANDPEGPFKEYNAAVRLLKADSTSLSHREVRSRLRDLSRSHGLRFDDAHLELFSRLMEGEDYYRRHPVQALWWLLRYSRPGHFRQRWEELRTGSVSFAA